MANKKSTDTSRTAAPSRTKSTATTPRASVFHAASASTSSTLPRSDSGAAPANEHAKAPQATKMAELEAFVGNLGWVGVKVPTHAELAEAVPMAFEEGKGAPDVQLTTGAKFLLTYDPNRVPDDVRQPLDGKPAHAVTAFIDFQPIGKRIEAPAIGFEAGANGEKMPRPAPVLVEVPEGTEQVSVWFRQNGAGERAHLERWDSGYDHQNYNFPVGQRAGAEQS